MKSKYRKKEHEINNDIDMVSTILRLKKNNKGQGVSRMKFSRSKRFRSAEMFILQSMKADTIHMSNYLKTNDYRMSSTKLVPYKNEESLLYQKKRSYSHFLQNGIMQNHLLSMNKIRRVRKKRHFKNSISATKQVFDGSKSKKELERTRQKCKIYVNFIAINYTRSFYDFMPLSKEEEVEEQSQRLASLKKKRMSLGRVIMGAMSKPISNTRKVKKIGRKGQQVQS